MLNNMNDVYINRFLNRKPNKVYNYISSDDVYISIMFPHINPKSLKGYSRYLFLSATKRQDFFVLFKRKINFILALYNQRLNNFFVWAFMKMKSTKLPKIKFLPFINHKEILCN